MAAAAACETPPLQLPPHPASSSSSPPSSLPSSPPPPSSCLPAPLAREEERVEASTASPDAPANTGWPRVGKASPEARRTVRSLRCGPGSAKMPGRAPGGDSFCPRKTSCVSRASTSLMAVAVFCLHGAVWWVASATAVAMMLPTTGPTAVHRQKKKRATLVEPPASISLIASRCNGTLTTACHRVRPVVASYRDTFVFVVFGDSSGVVETCRRNYNTTSARPKLSATPAAQVDAATDGLCGHLSKKKKHSCHSAAIFA